jgi:tetratricopeptide (TPR) repeat protein
LLLAVFLAASCTPREKREFDKGLRQSKEKNFTAAVESFEHSILLNPESETALLSARDGVKIAQLDLKDYKKAAKFLEILILNSPDENERIISQKQLALLYFDQLAEYKKGIQELNKTILVLNDDEEKNEFRMKLAKAYYFSNNFSQSESEANLALSKSKNPTLLFQALLLKGNIFLVKKDLAKATAVFNELLEKFPEKAVKENAAMTLAVAYEEMKDYKSAIQVLEKMKKYHSTPEYIDLKIARLNQQSKNLPGAHGTRKK